MLYTVQYTASVYRVERADSHKHVNKLYKDAGSVRAVRYRFGTPGHSLDADADVKRS